MKTWTIENKKIAVSGRLVRIARLETEYHEWIENPQDFLVKLETQGVKADIFTFLQGFGDHEAHFDFQAEPNSMAVLQITTYDDWWTKQINYKTRNMIRKAEKSCIKTHEIEFSDELVKGIKNIYDENPLRQGRPFKHYHEDLATLKKTHITFLERSKFIGAFHNEELIGFAKLVRGTNVAFLMQIVSMIGHRDKAPTNALIAKAVKICAESHIPYLCYGVWSRRGLGDFKKHHAFIKYDLVRYFIPLNARGKIALAMNLHHRLVDKLPETWIDFFVKLRTKWNTLRQKRTAGTYHD